MLRLRWHAELLGICRLDPETTVPWWYEPASRRGPIAAVVRTKDELSLIVPAAEIPETIDAKRDFLACQVVGPLDFDLVGILHGLLQPLRDAGIAVLAISTFDTDWILVQRADAARAAAALGTVAVLENQPAS